MVSAATAPAAHTGESRQGEPASTPTPPTKSVFTGRRKLVLAAAPVVVGVVGGGLWYSGLLARLTGGGKKEKASGDAPRLFTMPPLITNLDATGNVERYVKADIRLVVAGPSALAAVRSHEPELQDMFLSYLRDMRAGELERPTSTWRLRESLLDRAAVIVGPGRVTNILFTTLLIQ